MRGRRLINTRRWDVGALRAGAADEAWEMEEGCEEGGAAICLEWHPLPCSEARASNHE